MKIYIVDISGAAELNNMGMAKCFANKAEAMKAEKALHAVLDAKFDRAFVQFGAWQMEGYKQNRGWDWWMGAGLDIVKEEVK